MAIFSCGALPVVLVLFRSFFFSLLVTSERVRQADMEECWSRRSDRGGTVHDCLFFRAAPAAMFLFLFFFFFILHHEEGQ